MRKYLLLSLLSLLVPFHSVLAKEICQFTDEKGQIYLRPKDSVPPRYQERAKCRTVLDKPKDIQLSGNIREETISSPLGNIHLRWPRKVEQLFGRNPLRATADAARAVSKSIRGSSFPTSIQKLNLDWQIVFMDEELSSRQIPRNLISGCHPGWMTPPANIYIVGQRVAAGCENRPFTKSSADQSLAQVLLHEMGHAVEFYMLGSQMGRNRMRAEGFASWFEQHAARYSSMVSEYSVKDRRKKLAQESLRDQPEYFEFRGSAQDYSRAATYFQVIVERTSLRNLIDIYEVMATRRLDFFPAIENRIGWNKRKIDEEVRRALK